MEQPRLIRSSRLINGAVACVAMILCCAFVVHGQRPGPTERTARYFDSIRSAPPQLLAFLLQMPKGGDLHNHLSGAIYAESYIQWAADSGACVSNTTMAASLPPCSSGQVPIANALTNSILYRQLIDAWSMRNWKFSGQSGRDHFFDAFARFGVATYNQTGKMLSEVVARAAHGNV